MHIPHTYIALLPVAILFCAIAPGSAETPATATAAAPAPAACAPCAFEPEALALEKILKQYKELADNGGWPAWKAGKKIRTGWSDARIPVLRQLLTITGDYSGSAGVAATSLQLDPTLSEAVKRFQLRHGLNADGQVGKSTQAALTVPVERRITQIMATLARIRGRTQAPEEKFILVNLPSFTLYAISHGQTAQFMRVIVGNRKNHTPLFDNRVTDVIFNPQWHVPERIARNELVPKLKEDPSYFVNAGFVVTQDGEPVDPMHVNPTDDDFSFRQLAGRGNALGKIKFNIPDSDDIYLHSTSSPRLFNKDDRALSHGCIRVEKPRELAHFVLAGSADWNDERIDHSYDADKERWVKVEAIPVHLVYWTAFVDARGVPYFYTDIYNKDDATLAQSHTPPVTLAQK